MYWFFLVQNYTLTFTYTFTTIKVNTEKKEGV